MNPSNQTERHNERMRRTKEIVDQRIAEAQEERGVFILLTGNGKGKSSSAFGMVARALGHGQKTAIIQFVKGRMETGEQTFFSQQDQVDFYVMGDGFTWETQNRDKDIASAQQAWKIAQKILQDPRYDLVVLDEMTYLFKYNYLDLDEVISTIKQRPKMQNVIITGRGAKKPLKQAADTVSVIMDEKHAFKAGVKAQKGIEW
ncbi:MAG TPA: cob(I)yrinic acid a,c-diamide adenosyltransferase [Leucothrix mucor]|uniref:Corrinoid adenosyltransferase n=1 Tax=Leucothrix mucor TaxID=45248 RepID=A0A7V2T415_LEUMU|nr:cob(I)yrinic acid a,c-diamide adenosyltransferase [Leucothrix mucor]